MTVHFLQQKMNELVDITNNKRIPIEMTTSQRLYVNKMLKPYEYQVIQIKTHMIEDLYDFHELTKRKNKRNIYYITNQHLLKQKKKPTDLFMDDDTDYIGQMKEHRTYSTSRLDTGLHDTVST